MRRSGDVAGALTPGLLQGISDRAWQHGQEMLVYTGWPHLRDRYSATTFLSGHVDGLIWIAPPIDEPILDEVAEAELPVVAVMTSTRGGGACA